MISALSFFLLSHSLAAHEPPLLVERRDFACLVKNIDTLPRNRKYVYVDIGSCPPEVLEDSYPDPPGPPVAGKVNKVLSLDRDEIACIRTNRRNLAAIARPAGPGRYRIDLHSCRRRPS